MADIVIPILAGGLAGTLSGFGIGGGTLLMLYLTAVAGMDQQPAAGINLLYFLCCVPAALTGHIRHKLVQWPGLWIAVAAGMAAAAGGALLANIIPADWIRRGFGGLLLVIGGRELMAKKEKETQ